MVSYQCSLLTLSRKCTIFEIFDIVSLKPRGLGSLKVMEDDTIQSGTHDFLLTFHSNNRPISHRFRYIRRFPSKITKFSHPRVFNTPAEGVPLGIGYWYRSLKKLEWCGYQKVKKVLR